MIFEARERPQPLIDQLYQVWKKSVIATHAFLSGQEVEKIAQAVPAGLREVPHLIIAVDPGGVPAAFMGISGEKLEMLFVTPEERGNGVGKQLLLYGIQHYAVNELGVNEQNPQAKGFYEHMGFRVWKRADMDEQGNPYPILYMKRA